MVVWFKGKDEQLPHVYIYTYYGEYSRDIQTPPEKVFGPQNTSKTPPEKVFAWMSRDQYIIALTTNK